MIRMYTQIEICRILIACETATELLNISEFLQDTGNALGGVAWDVYDHLMLNLVFLKGQI